MISDLLPKRIMENIDQFVGRSWLPAKILDWLDHTDDRLFLLTGGPGTGKSMLLAWLAGFGPPQKNPAAQAQRERLRGIVKAVHFCQASSRNITPQAFAESVANQLTETVPGFGGALASSLADRVSITGTVHANTAASGSSLTGVSIGRIDLGTLGDEFSFDRAFTVPLKRLYQRGYSEPILVLIDALDEAQIYTGVKIPELLSQLIDLPAGLRILATTREEPRVLKFFSDFRHVESIESSPDHMGDIKEFALQRLRCWNPAIADADLEDFAQRLTTQAAGIFLYAALVLDELQKLAGEQVPDLARHPLPEGLSGIYHNFLNRELGKDEQRWYELFKPLLGLIAVSQGDGLSATQLGAIIGKEIAAALRASKQYLIGELPDGPFRPFHRSFAEFLLESNQNKDYRITPQEMHQRITDYYWKHCHGDSKPDWTLCDTYGLDSMSAHLFEACEFDRLRRLVSRDWMRLRIANYRFDGIIADVERAWRAAVAQSSEQGFGESIRCALIRTSINSVSRRYPPQLVARSLDLNLWTSERVFAVASNLPDRQAIRMWSAILGTRKLDQITKARAAQSALTLAKAMPDPAERASSLLMLVPSLDGEMQRDAVWEGLRGIEAITTTSTRVANIARFYSLIPEEHRTHMLTEALASIGHESLWRSDQTRSFALKDLAPLLDATMSCQAAEYANGFKDAEARVSTLAILIPQLPPERKEANAQLVFEYVRSEIGRSIEQQEGSQKHAGSKQTPPIRFWLGLLKSVAGFLNSATKHQMVFQDGASWLRKFDEDSSFMWLFEIVPRLDPQWISVALENAAKLPGPRRMEAYTALAPLLSKDEVNLVFKEIEELMQNAASIMTVKIAGGWLPYTDGATRDRIIRYLLAGVDRILVSGSIKDNAAVTLAMLIAPFKTAAPHIPNDLLNLAMQISLAPQMLPFRDELLASLAPKLPGDLLKRALDVIGDIDDRLARITAISTLAPHLTGAFRRETLQYALATVAQIPVPYWRAKAVARLAPLIEGEEQMGLLHDGLLASSRSGIFASVAFALLTPYLRNGLIQKALDAAEQVVDDLEGSKEECLAIVGKLLPSTERNNLASQIIASLPKSQPQARERILERLVPCCEGDLLQKCRLEAKHVTEPTRKVKILVEIATRLSGDEKGAVMQETKDAIAIIADHFERAISTVAMAKALIGEARIEALSNATLAAKAIDKPFQIAEVLTELLPMLSDESKHQTISWAFERVRKIEEPGQSNVLAELTPYLTGDLIDQASAIAGSIKDVNERIHVFSFLSARLLQLAADRDARELAFRKICSWLYSFRTVERSQILYFLSVAFSNNALTEAALKSIASNIREITAEWRFDPAASISSVPATIGLKTAEIGTRANT